MSEETKEMPVKEGLTEEERKAKVRHRFAVTFYIIDIILIGIVIYEVVSMFVK